MSEERIIVLFTSNSQLPISANASASFSRSRLAFSASSVLRVISSESSSFAVEVCSSELVLSSWRLAAARCNRTSASWRSRVAMRRSGVDCAALCTGSVFAPALDRIFLVELTNSHAWIGWYDPYNGTGVASNEQELAERIVQASCQPNSE